MGSLLFLSILGGIGGFAYGAGGVSIGFFTGLGLATAGTLGGTLIGAAAVMLLWTIGYGIVTLYEKLNPITHQRAEKLLF